MPLPERAVPIAWLLLLGLPGVCLASPTVDRVEPLAGTPVLVSGAGGGCGPDDCVGRGEVWAPMWDLRGEEMRWEIRASSAGAVAVGSWFDTWDWLVEVYDEAGGLVGTIEPQQGHTIYEMRFCSNPGEIYTVVVLLPEDPKSGLHYRMYWRGIDWARTAAPLASDPELGFDQRWGVLPARFADTTWFVEVLDGAEELILSYEHVTGDGTGQIVWIPPDGSPEILLRSSGPGAGIQHWPARYPGCTGPPTSKGGPPPPPTRECTYYDVFDPVEDPAPGFWGLRMTASCDGDPSTPAGLCDPYAAHYILERHDGGPRWLYLDRRSFENPDIEAVAAAEGLCGDLFLDGSDSWSNSGGLQWSWYGPDGSPLGTGPTLDAELETACGEVTLEVSDRCGLRDTAVLPFTDEVAPQIVCPPDAALPVDSACRGMQETEALATDDCAEPVPVQDPPYPLEATLGPDECTRSVPVRASADDGCGNEASCGWRLTFVDATPPSITCPRELDATPDLFEIPADDRCRGVFDEPAMADDNCALPAVETDPALPLLLGPDDLDIVRPVDYRTEDACGAEASCGVAAVLVDLTPPVIEEIGFDGGCLWPPHHKYVCLEVARHVEWSDNCSDPGADCSRLRAVSCRSDQPDETHGAGGGQGDGRSFEDCRIEGDGSSVCLRSERQGRDREDGFDGRTYEIELEAVDCSGNATRATARLLVPHDRHRGAGSCAGEILP